MGVTQATAQLKGYLMQEYHGIYFFFHNENYKKIKNIKLEAKLEDIEIEYLDNSKDYIQVKTTENIGDVKFHSAAFKKGVGTLKNAYFKSLEEGVPVNRIIYANNMVNQGIPRITEKIKNGLDENFILPFLSLSEEERDKLCSYLENDIGEDFKSKLHISRVDDSYYLQPTKVLRELEIFLDKLELKIVKENLFNNLKVLFLENGIKRKEVITPKRVAWIFLKRVSTSYNILAKFDDIFSEELDEIGYCDGIEDLLTEESLLSMIEENSDYIEIYQHYEAIEIRFEISNGKIKKSNRKEFILQGAKEFLDKNYLFLEEKYTSEERELIYAVLFFFVGKKKKENRKIYDEFLLNEK